jgi:N-acyl-phosphatidylethanolamine-hydrolysing phospholipase D
MNTGTCKFTWIGGPTYLLEVGEFKVLADPMLSKGPQAFIMHDHPNTGEETAIISRLAPLPSIPLKGMDLVLISHLHSDHFDSEAASILDKHPGIVSASDHKRGIEEKGFSNGIALDWWQSITYAKGNEQLTLTALPAYHSHDPRMNIELGVVNGYLIEFHSGGYHYKIYWTGDTVWFDEMVSIRQRVGDIDLLIPHLGAVGKDGPFGMMTLNADEAERVIDLFNPQAVIPIHHHTFSHYVEPIGILQAKLRGTAYSQRLHILTEGESLCLDIKHQNQNSINKKSR